MIPRRRLLAAGLATLAAPSVVRARPARLQIGMCTTLSGPAGYLGADIRDGFQLAMADGRLGGVPVELVVEDDRQNGARARQIVHRYVNRDAIRIYTGIVFSTIVTAAVPDILAAGGIYIGTNAAPANLAGKDCNPNYYVVSWQDDSPHESAGENANLLGHERMYLLAPDTGPGRAALAAFRRYFKGEIAGEAHTAPRQSDFTAELAAIRAARPDGVFQCEAGDRGIAFIRQYHRAGLPGRIPLVLPAPALDAVMLQALGDLARGIEVTSQWNRDFDNVANRNFIADFTARHHRMPTRYASQGYDAGLALGAALFQTKGEVEDTEVFRAAMLPAEFQSVRGAFRFNTNQEPIQDWWGLRVERAKSGRLALVTRRRVFKDHTDRYVNQCRL